MRCYMWVDLHAQNSVVVVSDGTESVLPQRRFYNDRSLILTVTERYLAAVQGIAVESTHNWY